MKYDFSGGLSEAILARIRRHSAGADKLKSRTLKCHYCEHKSIVVYEDSRGHVQAKCRKCGKESVYNVVLRRSGTVEFRSVRD
jgi:ribosomal protein S27E